MLLSSVNVNRRNRVRVTWREGYQPIATPYVGVGTVFLSKGRETYVTWDVAPERPVCIATVALQVVK